MAYRARFRRAGKLLRASAGLQRAWIRALTPGNGPQDKPQALRLEPGRFVGHSHANRAGRRDYKLYTPASYRGQALPLVVMLHGCGQGPDDFAAATRMNALADELGFVVAYPAQSDRANASRCWNWFKPAHQKRGRGEPSLIAGITREILARGLDEQRVYVAGLSAGGAMAAVMGAEYPDLYAAVGVHSGLAHAAARDLSSALAAMGGRAEMPHEDAPRAALPMIWFHGDQDTTVHPSNGHFIRHGRSSLPAERGERNGRPFTRTLHPAMEAMPALEHWIVHGAGHAWSGGCPRGSFADPQGPDASREMLRFFLAAKLQKSAFS